MLVARWSQIVLNVNTDINVLGSIVDLTLIGNLINIGITSELEKNSDLSISKLKTARTFQRYERAIQNTLILFTNEEIKTLIESVFIKDGLSDDCLSLLFLNASVNNDLLDYINRNVYFPAYFSGRISIQKSEIIACITDLKQSEVAVKKWSDSTLDVVSRKYLAFLHKFRLLEGGRNKTIRHKYMDDKELIVFIYWLTKIETKPNLLTSKWLTYCFLDSETFIKRVLQKKFMKYIDVSYNGDWMKLGTQFSYKDIYNELTKS
jgi:hypothetical protein